MSAAQRRPSPKPSNFLRALIERELDEGTYARPPLGRQPGRRRAPRRRRRPTRRRSALRFPPEPNGYLHIGHAKSICLNFGLARDYGGVCHLRFDDTNPEKEEQEYVDAIVEAVHWLGFDWKANGTEHLYYASNYFDFMYRAAEALIERRPGLCRRAERRRDARQPRRLQHARHRQPLARPHAGREPGALSRDARRRTADGSTVLRAKIDMASPNINLRDPALYRIKRATTTTPATSWCIYPMYTYAHPIEDALENITHSICTLEFEDQRPFYDWLLDTPGRRSACWRSRGRSSTSSAA